jgi:hypothetical protein
MFFTFTYDDFPLVCVTFNEEPITEKDLDTFFVTWLQLYMNQKDFIYLFDTRDLANIPSLKYAIKVSLFMKKLKKEHNKHYLQKSLILINNKKIQRLLDFTFSLQGPVAPVFIYLTDEKNNVKLNELALNCKRDALPENMIYLKPDKNLIINPRYFDVRNNEYLDY